MYKRLTIKDEEYGNYVDNKGSELSKPKVAVSFNGKIHGAVIDRLAELEDKMENGTLVELEKPYIRQLNSIPQQDKYIICKAQEVGITGVLTKAEAIAKLRELKENNND